VRDIPFFVPSDFVVTKTLFVSRFVVSALVFAVDLCKRVLLKQS